MAGETGASTDRLLNRLQYAASNKATLATTLATGDLVPFADVSADYAIKFATPDEIRRGAQLSQTPVSLTATTAITKALHEGRPLLMGASGAALTFTLPAATGSGDIYLFIVSVVNTSNYLIKASAGTMLFTGTIIGASTTDSATDAARTWIAGASDDSLLLNGTTRGGLSKGDYIRFIDCSATQWYVEGVITQSGSEATPFENTVA
jgi:hypothetical protein